MAVYAGEWERYGDIQWPAGYDPVPEADVVYAGYECEGYEGSATLVFAFNGQLWESGGSHCSCDGLEMSDPEAMPVEALVRYPHLTDALVAWLTARASDRLGVSFVAQPAARAVVLRH